MSGPVIALLWAMPERMRRPSLKLLRRRPMRFAWAAVTSPLAAFVLHAFALWIWHLPVLYGAALAHESLHMVQHLCFFGTAALFWWGIEHGRYGRAGLGMAVVFVFATAVHSGTLGALLTLSPRLWYPEYDVSHSWGLTALEDQQLAGLVMWIPAGLIVAGGGLMLFARWIQESDRHTRFPSASVHNSTGIR
jgi:cytochrome c oxidase assembly factor CtaG